MKSRTGFIALCSILTFSLVTLTRATGESATDVSFEFDTTVPCNVFTVNDVVTGKLAVVKPSPDLADITVAPVIRDVQGKVVATLRPVTLSKANGWAVALTGLPHAVGYYSIEAGKIAEAMAISYVVVPALTLKDHDLASPFGVNGGDPSAIVAAKRVGIAWIRASTSEGTRKAVRDNKLCLLVVWDDMHSPSHEQFEKWRRPDGQWDFSEAFQLYVKSAKQFGADIDAYDIVNEANWSDEFGGSWDGGPWVPVYLKFMRQAAAALHAADPGKPVLWEGDPNVGPDLREMAENDKSLIDVFSPHVYSLHRSRSLPEENDFFKQLPGYYQLMREHNLNWPLWVGEFGFSAFRVVDPDKMPPFYSPNTEIQQAQNLARMITMMLARGVKKVFWYDLEDNIWDNTPEPGDPEYHFGLMRYDRTPKPAILAYADLVYQLSGAQWLGYYYIGGGGEAYAFTSARTGKPVVVAWLLSGAKNENIYVSDTKDPVKVTDVFGAEQTVAVEGKPGYRSVPVPLSETPVFIEGLSQSDVERDVYPLPR